MTEAAMAGAPMTGAWQPLCQASDIPAGEGRSFPLTDGTDRPRRILVVRHVGGFRAYHDRCAHFGVPLGVTPAYRYVECDAIVCQVHYARYAVTDGRCLKGDCDGEGLEPVPMELRDGEVWVRVT